MTAAEGAAPELLARRMRGVERPLDVFLLINGLDREQSLTSGEK